MEEQYFHENPLQLMSFAFGGIANDASQSYQDDPNHKYVMAAGRNQIFPTVPAPISHWIHCQETSPGSVEYITERRVTEISREMSYHNVRKVGGNAVFEEVNCARPQIKGQMNIYSDAEYQLHSQGQESNEPHSRALVAAPSLAKLHNRASRRRTTSAATDRARKKRIAERLDALHELLPKHNESSKASQLDDTINYIKYLQLQIKDLSLSKLGGEPTAGPFVFLEGYGHYILHEHMSNEPLEEMMGKLLEVNQLAASRLLESRGLVIMPTDLAEGLHQAV